MNMKNTLFKLALFSFISIFFSCSTNNANSPVQEQKEIIFPEKLPIIYQDRNDDIPYRTFDPFNDRFSFNYYTDKEKVFQEMQDANSPIYIDSLVYKFNNGLRLKKKECVAMNLLAIHYHKSSPALHKLLEEQLEKEDYENAIITAKKILEKSPFSLHAAGALMRVYEATNGTSIFHNKIMYIGQFIQSSNTVSTSEDPSFITDKYSLDYFAKWYAIGAGYQFEKETKDQFGNPMYAYSHVLGKDFFIVPSN